MSQATTLSKRHIRNLIKNKSICNVLIIVNTGCLKIVLFNRRMFGTHIIDMKGK